MSPEPHQRFDAEEYRRRLQRTSAALKSIGLDCLLAFANRVHPGHVRYLSGYETRHGIHDCAFLLFTPGMGSEVALFTNVSWEDVGSMSWATDIQIASMDRLPGLVAERLPSRRLQFGIAGLRALPAPILDGLRQALPGAVFSDASDLMLCLRQIKSAAEIAVLRQCAEISDAGARAFWDAAQPGRSERELQAAVETALTLAGSEGLSFATQIGTGERTARVCMYASDRRLRKGEVVQLDCGGIWLGYRGDISRVAVLSPVADRHRALVDTTAEMYQAMLRSIRPGSSAGEVARVGISVAVSRGFQEYLYRSPNVAAGFMGHGIGCSFHEPPEITPGDETILREGMVLVIEPILAIPGIAGVKLEDAVVVTAQGAERLSQCSVTHH